MDNTYDIQQLVVIAKPGPDQPYCQLATAFQSCWCQRSILHACLNALDAFADQRHRIGILQELAFAAEIQAPKADLKLPAHDYYQTNEQKDADCRFPYITATLVSNMVCCVGDKHTNHQCALEAPVHAVTVRAANEPVYAECYTKSVSGTRSVGYIGVIDITDLGHLRYCFLSMQVFCVKCGLAAYHPGMKTTVDVFDGDVPEWEMVDYTPSSGEPLSYRIDFDSNGDLGPLRPEKDVKAFEMLQAYPLIDVTTLEGKIRCCDFIRKI